MIKNKYDLVKEQKRRGSLAIIFLATALLMVSVFFIKIGFIKLQTEPPAITFTHNNHDKGYTYNLPSNEYTGLLSKIFNYIHDSAITVYIMHISLLSSWMFFLFLAKYYQAKISIKRLKSWGDMEDYQNKFLIEMNNADGFFEIRNQIIVTKLFVYFKKSAQLIPIEVIENANKKFHRVSGKSNTSYYIKYILSCKNNITIKKNIPITRQDYESQTINPEIRMFEKAISFNTKNIKSFAAS